MGRWWSVRKGIAALVLLLVVTINIQAQEGRRAKPPRIFTISGQVSLPNGRPAANVIVKLTTRGGVPKEVFTNDAGRFEFSGMDAGGYVLSAKSVADPQLLSDNIETDTSLTSTDDLNVNIVLREADRAASRKPAVVQVEDIDQRIPKVARNAFRQALKFRRSHETTKAFESLARAIESYPAYYQALSERGDLYVFERKLTEAAEDFDRALKISAHYAPALRGSGYCKLEKREFAGAIELFEKSISADHNNANTHLLLGIANLELDRRESARAALQKALSFNTQTVPRAHIYLANLYAREHQYLQAADELHKYIEAEPFAADVAGMREIEGKWRARAAAP